MLSSSSSSTGRGARRSTRLSSSSSSSGGTSSTSSSSLKRRAGGRFRRCVSSSSSAPSTCSAVGPLESIASRSRISRSCMWPLLSAVDQSMIALKVIGLSHRPQIIVSRPASMRLAMAISPSRESSSTAPISRRYMRTGSSVRSTVSFFFSRTKVSPAPSDLVEPGSCSASRSSSSASSFSTMLTPISESADITSSICSEDIWSCGSASFSSS